MNKTQLLNEIETASLTLEKDSHRAYIKDISNHNNGDVEWLSYILNSVIPGMKNPEVEQGNLLSGF